MRFYFNLRNGNGLLEDEEGRELAGLEAARAEWVRSARAIIADEAQQGRLDLRGRIEIVDGKGRPLLVIPFADTVTIERGGAGQS